MFVDVKSNSTLSTNHIIYIIEYRVTCSYEDTNLYFTVYFVMVIPYFILYCKVYISV